MNEAVTPIQLLATSFYAILPAFGWILLGMALRRLTTIKQTWFSTGEKFVFYLGVPAILVISIA